MGDAIMQAQREEIMLEMVEGKGLNQFGKQKICSGAA
jgi:hypothetical protein